MRRASHVVAAALAGLVYVLLMPLYGALLLVKFLTVDAWRAARDLGRAVERRLRSARHHPRPR